MSIRQSRVLYKFQLQSACVTCNPTPLFSICFIPQDIIIRHNSGPHSLMVRDGLWICYLLLRVSKNRYHRIVNPYLSKAEECDLGQFYNMQFERLRPYSNRTISSPLRAAPLPAIIKRPHRRPPAHARARRRERPQGRGGCRF